VIELFGHRPSCLEQSSAARRVSTVTGRLPQSPQDLSLQALLPMTALLSCRARISDVVIADTLLLFVTYLLKPTYLLTYLLTN